MSKENLVAAMIFAATQDPPIQKPAKEWGAEHGVTTARVYHWARLCGLQRALLPGGVIASPSSVMTINDANARVRQMPGVPR